MTRPDLTNLDNHEVFDRARRGDSDACRELMRRFRRPVFDAIYTVVGNRELAKDLAQETFAKAFRSLEHAGPERNPAAWMRTIASTTALGYVRRPRPDSTNSRTSMTPTHIDVPMHPLLSHDTPLPTLDERRVAEALQAAMKDMRPEYRRCLMLRYVENRSYDDIAKTMRIPANSVGTYLVRARKQLKQLMGATLDSDPAHTPA